MKQKIQDEATIRLLKVLGELTPDLEINDCVTAMNVASVRIKRLEAKLNEDDWIDIKSCGLPIDEGEWYDAYTYTREGVRTVRELFFDGVNEHGVHWLGDGDWPYPVTHYKDRPAPPKIAEEELTC